MTRTRSALVFAVLSSCVLPSIAAAQTTVQGQIIIQEVPSTSAAPPPPQAQVYVTTPTPQPQSVYVTPSAPAQPQCPAGSQLQVDAYGRATCMVETTRHHISGGLLGGGIGLLAGGWLLTWVTGTIVVVGGAVGCGLGGGCSWTSDGSASAFFNWSWVPVLGPWVEMGYLWPNADVGMFAWLAVEGLIQAGGLVMLIFGAIGEDSVVLEPAPGYALRVSPMVTASAQGLSAELTF